MDVPFFKVHGIRNSFSLVSTELVVGRAFTVVADAADAVSFFNISSCVVVVKAFCQPMIDADARRVSRTNNIPHCLGAIGWQLMSMVIFSVIGTLMETVGGGWS